MGGANSRVQAYIASSTSPPYVSKQLTTLFNTQQMSTTCVQQCSTDDTLCILVKAQASTEAPGHGHN